MRPSRLKDGTENYSCLSGEFLALAGDREEARRVSLRPEMRSRRIP